MVAGASPFCDGDAPPVKGVRVELVASTGEDPVPPWVLGKVASVVMAGNVALVVAPVTATVPGMSATEVAAAGPLAVAVVSTTWGRVTMNVETV